jgi:hypothetical protein
LLDCRADLRIADFPLILQFVGRELRDDIDYAARDLEIEPVPGLMPAFRRMLLGTVISL